MDSEQVDGLIESQGSIERQEAVAAFVVERGRLCLVGHAWQCHWQAVKL